MENKIQELTDKIYREGVEKGNEEAQKLIAKAQEEAKRIIEDAHKEADSIVATAYKSADELAENTKSELKLFAGQAVNALKSEIATLVTDNIVNADVKAFAANKDYLNAFIVGVQMECERTNRYLYCRCGRLDKIFRSEGERPAGQGCED